MPKRVARRTPVAQVAAQWLEVYVATSRSEKNMHMAAQRVRDFLVPEMGRMPVGSVCPDDFRRYRIALERRGLAPRTVRHLLTDVRCMFNWAVDGRIIDRNPFPRRAMPRVQETPPDRLTDPEVAAVLAIPEPQAFVVRLGLGTGMRWAEMCRARREHVVNGMLTVAITKSGRMRRIPLHCELAREISYRPGPMVPYTDPTTTSFNRFVRNNSGVPRFHVHQLRHVFACKWIERGGSLPSLQQILGHASVVTTQMYAKLSDDAVRAEAERLNGAEAHAQPRAPLKLHTLGSDPHQ